MLRYDHLEGRPFQPGEVHCYRLVQDFYLDNFGIKLRDYAVPVDWDGRKFDLIEMGFEREGGFKVPDWNIRNLQPGDILAVALRSAAPNHLCIYVGENKILHHLYGQLSKTETLRDFWRMSTCYVLRHKDVVIPVEEKPTLSLMEFARARYNPQAEPEAQAG